jgi:2-alkyl-3-oxoalkanoate reductase
MRIFVAGAGGAVGRRLVPLLVSAGHSVVGLTHTPAKADAIRAAGAEAAIVDGLNRAAVVEAVAIAKPDVIVLEMTSLSAANDLRKSSIYNIVDDEPVPVREWLPALADMLGAKAPWCIPK